MAQPGLAEVATILVVEDEAAIRMLAAEAIADAGFQVIEAEHGVEALELLETRAMRIHMLFTDVHMPGEIDGVELVRHASGTWPWLRLMVTSGRAMLDHQELPNGCRFIAKPYRLSDVKRHLQDMMNGHPGLPTST